VSNDRLYEHHEHIEGDRKGETDITEYYIEANNVIAVSYFIILSNFFLSPSNTFQEMKAKDVVWKLYYKKDK
jgi:hypothetical protein